MKKLFVFLAVTIWLTGVCFAQDKPAAKKEQPTKQKQIAPVAMVKQESQKPPGKFSISMIEGGRIDIGYKGFPVSAIIDAIEKMAGTKKGEFESTSDYNARRVVALAGQFLGNSSVEDVFAFVLPVVKGNLGSGFRYDFDADNSVVRLFALPTSSYMNGVGAPDYETNRRTSKDLDSFEFEFKLNSKSTYEGSNAYGATVTVEKTNSSRRGIAVNKIPFLTFERESVAYVRPTPAAQFNLENAKAAKELPVLRALVVMKMVDPYIVYDFFHSEPTRDLPRDVTSDGKYLTGNVLGIVFYSGVTGEIFARLPDDFGRPEPKTETKSDGQ